MSNKKYNPEFTIQTKGSVFFCGRKILHFSLQNKYSMYLSRKYKGPLQQPVHAAAAEVQMITSNLCTGNREGGQRLPSVAAACRWWESSERALPHRGGRGGHRCVRLSRKRPASAVRWQDSQQCENKVAPLMSDRQRAAGPAVDQGGTWGQDSGGGSRLLF